MSQVKLDIRKLPHARDIPLPSYATTLSVGLDLCAAIHPPIILKPGEKCLIPTGVAVFLPENLEGQVRPRSGLAARHGITILNSPGTNDPDYIGEIKVCLINLGHENYEINRGDRIAQLVIAPITRIYFNQVEKFKTEETGRNEQGFGSTGK